MDISVGLPNAISGTSGPLAIRWAVLAEDAGFTSLSVLDRLAYPIHEPMSLLAAVSAATSKIRLVANVVLAPTRQPFVLAKQAATIQCISDGRLVLGVGVGRRRDDYESVGRRFTDRGRRFDSTLEQLNQLWSRDEIMVPYPIPPVPLLIGGNVDATVDRVAKWGIGWTSGGSLQPHEVAAFADRIRERWRSSGREGSPHILALCYFSIGDQDRSRAQMLDYYGFMGPKAETLASQVVHDDNGILAARDLSAQQGIDELAFIPTINDIDQLRNLARIVLS